jgi:cellulose synthase operon protein YhjU
MGAWSYYFFAKLLMFCMGVIGFHVWENLAFALWTALPVRHWLARTCKQLLAVPAGVALLYYDSWLPPWQRILAQADQLADFSPDYWLELLARTLDLRLLLALTLMLVVWWLLSRKLRLSSFAVLGILAAPWLGVLAGIQPQAVALPQSAERADAEDGTIRSAQDLDAQLKRFYLDQAGRRVRFPAQVEGPPYDILLLQICSLAWDDLDFASLRDHPFMRRFDLRFTRFNAAASYSGPAAIRLLRAACGQPPHEALYAPADPACNLMDGLRQAGFEPQWAMNHDGQFGAMREDIRARGRLSAELFPLAGFATALRAFDGTSYASDYDVLSAWWRQRLQSPMPKVALYYNSGTLHDGNQFPDGSKPGIRDSYRRRAQTLFSELGRFLDELEASGRKVVVIMVPEHGANARGDRLQISGLREIPTPSIALVPVGVSLIDGSAVDANLAVDAPSSLFALSTLLATFAMDNPFAASAPPLADYARNLPQTEFVAENEGLVVMTAAGRHWQRAPDGRWSELLVDR